MEAPVSVFIGFSRSDEIKAQDLYDRLSEEGFRPSWASIRSVLPERDSSARLRAAIYNADLFLICLSNNSVSQRGALKQDLNEQVGIYLKGGQVKAVLVPVRLEECKIPKNLDSLESVDMFKAEGWSHLLELINSVIAHRRGITETSSDLLSDLDAAETMTAELASKSSFTGDDKAAPLEGPDDLSSPDAWSVDLRKLLGGRRELALSHLGGVKEYIESHLQEADDSEVAEHAFHEALEKLVQRWQPSTFPDRINLSYLLDLIGTYTPPGGYVKVIGLIQRLRQYRNTRNHDYIMSGGPDILFKALVILENYYIVAPQASQDSSASYKPYIDILKEELWNSEHSGYALKRLIELRIIDMESDEILILIEKTPGILNELINLLLDTNRQLENEDDLLRVLLICFNIGEEAVWKFEDAVKLCGGIIKIPSKEELPILIDFSGRKIHLKVSKEIMYKYQLYRWKRAQEEGLNNIKKLQTL